MKVLDLFSGIGGFSLGLERAGFETAAFCEFDEKCRRVLKKHWPSVHQYTDVREITAERLKNDGITNIGLICGGYPCQPFSVAGRQDGENDDRHLWPEIARLLKEFADDERPIEWCLFENVNGHITLGLDEVLADLEALGYTWWATVIPACAIGALHKRDRIWIVAHSNGVRLETNEEVAGDKPKSYDGCSPQPGSVSTNTSSNGLQRSAEESLSRVEHLQGELVRSGSVLGVISDQCESPILGTCDGFPGRVDATKQLGNAVVPQIVEMIGRAIMASAKEYRRAA